MCMGEMLIFGIGYIGVFGLNIVVDVCFIGFYGEVFVGLMDLNQLLQLMCFIDFDSGLMLGGWYYYYDFEFECMMINIKVQYFVDDFFGGSYDFCFGVQYNELSVGGIYGYNDLVLFYDIGGGVCYGYGYICVLFSYFGNIEVIGVFVDDMICINDCFLVNFGVCYDSNDVFFEVQQELNVDGMFMGVVFFCVDYYIWEYVLL